MSASFSRLRRVVEAALDLPPEAREAYVREQLADDPALVEEALGVLAATADESFLQGERSPPGRDPLLGSRLGRYEIVRVLGSGGMGTVYEARQDAPRRTVALKVLTALHPRAAERFRYEAELLGRLRHPRIATILEAGVGAPDHGGPERPWFAMEYVPDARTLPAHAAAQDLDESGRIALFLQVLDAVEYGHQQGVIHRDLKPDNILVDADGRVKIIDFGVARTQDPEAGGATMRTRGGEILGTLAYMSPEQVAGHAVDTRGDVYALGVVLYELLTGALPIDVRSTGFLVAARRIAEEAPRRPAHAGRQVPADLEAVLLTALAKEPARRYPAVGALAADLRRYLAGEAVTARTPGALHALRLFARRHRVAVGAAALVFGVTVAAAVISVGFAVQSHEAEQRAQQESERYRALFEAQFAASVETLAERAPEVAHLPGGQRAALRMTRTALERLQQLEGSTGEDPELTLWLADAYVRLAGGLMDPGARDEGFLDSASEAAERAAALAAAVTRRHADHAAAAAMLASTHAQRAAVHVARADLDAAAQSIEAGFAALPAQETPRARFAACRLEQLAGRIALLRGDPDAAGRHADRKIELAEGLLAASPDDGQLQDDLANGYMLRAQVHRRRRAFEDAARDLASSRTLLERLAAAHPERLTHRIDLGYALSWSGTLMMALGRREEAHAFYARTHALATELHDLAPKHVGVRGLLADALFAMGRVASDTGVHDHPRGSPERRAKLEEAVDWNRRAIEVYDAIEADGQLDADRRRDRDHVKRVQAAFERMLR